MDWASKRGQVLVLKDFCDLSVNDSSCLVSRKRASIFPRYSILFSFILIIMAVTCCDYFVLVYSHHYGCDLLNVWWHC